MTVRAFLSVTCLLFISPLTRAVAAEEPDLSSLYELRTEGSTQKVKVGEKGKFILSIKTKNGSHVSDEAPLRMNVSGVGLKPEKTNLTYADSTTKKIPNGPFVDPRFEVPFTVELAGKNSIDVDLTFFICTEKVCGRQSKKVHLAVETI